MKTIPQDDPRQRRGWPAMENLGMRAAARDRTDRLMCERLLEDEVFLRFGAVLSEEAPE
jgi:hypothetical protein